MVPAPKEVDYTPGVLSQVTSTNLEIALINIKHFHLKHRSSKDIGDTK